MFKLNRMLAIIFVSVFGVTLFACQLTQEQADTAVTQTETTTEDSNKLIIYSGRSESLIQPLVDQFAAASGLDVEVRYGGTAELAGVLLEEGENSPADLFYAQDPGGLGAVEAAGMLAVLPQDILEQVPARFSAESGAWVGISGRARTVVYNTDVFTDPENELPTDMWGYVGPEWNGRIGWAPSNGSFQAMVTAMRVTWGEEKTREWLQGIQANNPIVYPNNTPIVAGVAAGEVDRVDLDRLSRAARRVDRREHPAGSSRLEGERPGRGRRDVLPPEHLGGGRVVAVGAPGPRGVRRDHGLAKRLRPGDPHPPAFLREPEPAADTGDAGPQPGGDPPPLIGEESASPRRCGSATATLQQRPRDSLVCPPRPGGGRG